MGLSCRWRVSAALVAAVSAATMFVVEVPVAHAALPAAVRSGSTTARARTVLNLRSAPMPAMRGKRAMLLPKSGPPPLAGEGPDLNAPARRNAGADQDDTDSNNWSGQLLVGSTFTAVVGEWTVPAVVPSTATEADADWIGIGGDGISELIQTGTTSVTGGGSTSYYAWYELLPAQPVSIRLPEPVTPGDEMLAEIEETSTNVWYVGIEDVTKGWTAARTFTYTAGQANSAEWISERPLDAVTHQYVTLADFGSVRFHDMRFTAADPTATRLTAVTMKTAGQVIAYPGNVTSTTTGDFTDYYGAPAAVTTPATTTTPPKTTTPSTTTTTQPVSTTPPSTTTTSTSATTPPATTTTVAPTVTAVTPPSGPTAGGTTVVITGGNFTIGATVQFGAAQATDGDVVYVDSTEITAVAPAHTAGSVDVTVTVPAGMTSAASPPDRFDYQAPKVSSVSVHDGPTAGGTVVTITGSTFTSGATVRFGTKLATHVTVEGSTRIGATSPAHTAGAVDVTVTIPGGTSVASPAGLFRYQAPRVTSVSPRDGPTAGSTTVTIVGADFVRGATVRFGTKLATRVTVVSPTRIRATSPGGRGIVNVTVSIPGGSSVMSPGDRFEYRAA